MFVNGIGRAGEEATTTHPGPLAGVTTPTFVGVVEDDDDDASGLVVDVATVVVGLDVDVDVGVGVVVGCGCCWLTDEELS